MKTRIRPRAAGALACVLLAAAAASGCSRGRQSAAVSLDEARLAVSSARHAGAELQAAALFKTAESALTRAEAEFKEEDFRKSRKEAAQASSSARAAESLAKERASRRKDPGPALVSSARKG